MIKRLSYENNHYNHIDKNRLYSLSGFLNPIKKP